MAVVILSHRPCFPSHKMFWYSLLLEAEQSPETVLLEGFGKLKELSDFMGTRTRDLPACIIAPEPCSHALTKLNELLFPMC
jgi:hypothetical protein